jgi:hypothetical protein
LIARSTRLTLAAAPWLAAGFTLARAAEIAAPDIHDTIE